MPVNRGLFRQTIGHKHADTITLDNFDGGAWALTVVAPHIDFEAGRHFTYDRFGDQMKLFDTLVHPIRKRPAVQRHDGPIASLRPFCFRAAPWRRCARARLINRLGHLGQCMLANRSRGDRAGQTEECAVNEVSAFHNISVAFTSRAIRVGTPDISTRTRIGRACKQCPHISQGDPKGLFGLRDGEFGLQLGLRFGD